MNVQLLTQFLNDAGLSAAYRQTPLLSLAIAVRPGMVQENPVILTEEASHITVSWPSGRSRSETRFYNLDVALLFATERALAMAREYRGVTENDS